MPTTSTLVRGVLAAAGECAGVVSTLGARVGDAARSTRLTTPEAPELHGLLRWMLDAGATSAVVEASSIALDVGRADGLRVQVAVFTGFEEDHLDHPRDHRAVLGQQGAAVRPGADRQRGRRGRRAVGPPAGRPDPGAGRPGRQPPDADADVRVLSWRTGVAGTSLAVEDGDGPHWLCAPLVGGVHVGNIAAAWATGRSLGLDAETVAAGLATTAPPAGRNTLLRAPGGPLAVVDYAHTPLALAAAVRTARDLTGPGGQVHLVLGARGRRDRYKRQGLGVAARAADVVWLTNEGSHGERAEAIVEELRVGLFGGTAAVHTELDRRAAITAAVDRAGEADVVLVVGRGHETTLTDDGAPVPFDDAEVTRAALDARAVREAERLPNVVRTLTDELVADRAS